MDTYREQWKKRCKKRRKSRRKKFIYAISVTGMLSLSIYLCLSQGGSSRLGAKAANSNKVETGIEGEEYNQNQEDNSTIPNQNSELLGNGDVENDPLTSITGEDMISNDSNNEGDNEDKIIGDSDTVNGGMEDKEQNTGLEDNTTNAEDSNGNSVEETENDIENNSTSEEETPKGDTSSEDASNEETPKEENSEIEDEFFQDTIFIGDSRTEGLGQFGGVKDAKFYTYRGLMVNTAIGKDYITLDNKQKGNVLDAAKQSSFSKVYLMFGINELGWENLDLFIEYYRKIIDGIREIEPDCEIIIQANYPVTKKMDEGDKVYNNTNINKFNERIKKMAEEEGLAYLDLYSFFSDKDGHLSDKATSDGIHLNPSYYKDWKQCLIDFGSGNTER